VIGRGIAARDLRLAPAVVTAWAAAGVGVGVPDVFIASIMAWGITAVVVLVARGRSSVAGAIALAGVAAALVLTAVVAGQGAREPAALLDAAHGSRSAELTLTVTGRPTDGRVRATLTSFGGAAGLSSPVLLFASPDDYAVGRLQIGDRIALTGGVQSADPGEDVAFLVFARDAVRLTAPASGIEGVAAVMRSRFAAVAAAYPGAGAGLLPGLAIGDTSAVDPQLVADMKTSSLTHLTAVSGSNCAVVVGLVFAVAAALGMPRWVRVAASAVTLAGFVVLVTPEPSVLRAAAMAALALGALALSRPGRGIPLLCLAVIVLLVADPWLSRSYGFVLSVLATAGLLCLASPIAATLGRVLPRWIALLIAVPLSAQLACQPVLLLLDPSLPLYGVVANLLAEPGAPIATVFGLISCVLASVAPPLAGPVAGIAWLGSSWIAAVATFSAGLPGARSPWPTGPLGVVLLVLLSLAAIVVLVRAGSPRVQAVARSVLVIATVAYAATVVGGRIVVDLGRPADWQFALCDVGQGDAAVIRSAGQIALVDTGPKPERLAACLDRLGIGRIQLLVLTHYDLDHVGGVDAVVGRADRVLIGPPSDPGDVRIAGALRAAGADVDQVSRGEHGTLGGLDWRVVWPPPSGVEPGNPASVTLEVTPQPGCDCLSGIFLGDLGEESQLRLLGIEHPGHVDVVKVAHHGSADQAAPLYEALRSTVGLIGVGADNDYGHPTAKLLGILAAVGTTAERSDLDGLILVASGAAPGEVRVWTERGG
jgi:competence protein ComEC